MADAVPVFQDRAELLLSLRLQGSEDVQAQALINDSIRNVRVGIYGQLGETRVTALLAITPTETATTTDELDRLRANQLEILWNRFNLLATLPTIFRDSSAQVFSEWNEEALTREHPGISVSKLRDGIWKEILQLLDELSNEETRDLSDNVWVSETDESELMVDTGGLIL